MDAPILQIVQELRRQPPPEVLNFQVNDICNARCVMCNIWQNKRGREMSPEEFIELLRQPFFQSLKHIGITGGEPTLRGDLPRFYESLPALLPEFTGASFITNGFKTAEAIASYAQVHRAYSRAQKHFSGMVSIDGVGDVHDTVRGRPGSFAKATATLFGLRDSGVPVMAACTIVRSNVWGLHDMLDWARANGIYVRFRVGEFIRRLYNLKDTKEIRVFDKAETLHLVSFYHKLLLEYEKDEGVQRTYTSVLSILTGGERLITCPYQTSQSLNLDTFGRFAVCAPRGKATALGSDPARSTARVIERLAIRARHCPNCIHDYHGNWTVKHRAKITSAKVAETRLASTPPLRPSESRSPSSKRMLILGWYGTETAGDVAILGGLLLKHSAAGTTSFTVLSLYPYYSRLTLKPLAEELGVHLEIEPYDSARVINGLEEFGTVIMGGGPLMDIEQTELIRNLFRAARNLGIPCHVDGCGIGPLHQPRFQTVVAEILRLATEIRLRDDSSVFAARMLVGEVSASVVPEPSITYLRSLGIRWRPSENRVIRGWLRMLTPEYPQQTAIDESTEIMVSFLQKILDWHPQRTLELGAMHCFPVGWDDREFARKLAARLGDSRVTVDMVPRAPKEILARMASAELNLCMRFHSAVFAHTLGAPFVALDYTAGGKVSGFLDGTGFGGRELRYPDLPGLTRDGFSAHVCEPTTLPTSE
jgi:sulfatase maturation enzyme AslB (radical SAM superfamily)